MARLVRFLLAAILVAGAALTAACAAPRVTDAERASFGEVAVVTSDQPCEIDMDHPPAGWAEGLEAGFVHGLGALIVFPLAALVALATGSGGGSAESWAILAAAAIILAAAAAVVWIPLCMVGGSVTAIPPDEADAAEAVLLAVANDQENPALLTALVAQGARTWRRAAPVPRDRANTVVEVRLVSIRHGGSWNLWTVDRPFPILVCAEARVVRADGAVLWTGTQTAGAGGASHTYLEWAADGGAPFRREVEFQLTTLGRALSQEIFLTPGPESASDQRPQTAAPRSDE